MTYVLVEVERSIKSAVTVKTYKLHIIYIEEIDTLNNLYQVCMKFRNAIVKIPKSKLSISFNNFPFGSCGDTCLILGSFLYKSGFGIFDYVCGQRNLNSHAWLEKNGIIVDITADQFEDCETAVYVGGINLFYQSFDEDFRHKYFESLSGKSIKTDSLWKDYDEICQFI